MSPDSTLHTPTARLGEPALARCFALTSRQSNHLHRAALRLDSARRYEFFLATYAAMRALDDLVDREFLGRPPREREALRPRMLQQLERWESQVAAASRGEYRAEEGDLEPQVFEALDEFLARSDLDAQPFHRLATSLRRDLREQSLESWAEFLQYCEGAAVAPGAVFLYLLAAEEHPDGRFELPPSVGIWEMARDLAHFCYLTHIVRDLAEDAAQAAQLLTIPGQWLREAGFTRDSFRRAAAEEDEAVSPVARRILAEAQESGLKAEERLRSFSRELCVAHRQILDYLYALYREAHDGVAQRWR
jgi:phytoene synthase